MNLHNDIENGGTLPLDNLSNDTVSSTLDPDDFNLNNSFLTVDYVQSKIEEFSNLFNSTYRIPMLSCNSSERETLIYLLIALKKNIKCALQDLGKSMTKKEYQFQCGICDHQIEVRPGEDIWSSLQNHEHFEELFYKFLTNDLVITKIEEESNMPATFESESNIILEDSATNGDSNTDSGIEQQEMEPSTSGTQKITLTPSKKITNASDENINSFRFNFNVGYDEEVEAKLYPSSMMLGVRKYDKVKEFTIQRAGNTKAVCLICHCEMNGMRVSKHMLVNHSMGQKHLKAAETVPLIEILQFYHNFWLKQDQDIQAHQVFFRPDMIPSLRCTLCHALCDSDQIILHILSDIHKKKVLEMFDKRTNLYFLINLQVQVYGITQEQFDAKEKEFKEKEEVKVRERMPRKSSDSDTGDGKAENAQGTSKQARKMANQAPAVQHNIIRSVEANASSDPLDRIPHRMKDDIKFLKRRKTPGGTVIHCDLCNANIHDNVGAIEDHVVLASQHNTMKKDKYNYYCEICNVRVMSETGWKNHNFAGSRHVNMAASRKAKVTEYECTTCKTIIFGDELSLSRHLAVGNRGNRREKGVRLPDPIKVILQSKENILAVCAKLAEDAEEVLNNSLTKDCCESIKAALDGQFDDCVVYPFGSRISGIGNKASDLDVFVDTGNMYYGEQYQDPTEQVKLIRKAAKIFSKNKEYLNIVQVLTARTPIVKLHHISTKLDCDLSFKHGLSVENTKFLRFCIELQPVIQPLILLVKKWSEHINFECITTYALATMCIFYFQVNGYLLSVDKLRQFNRTEPKVINGWKTIAYDLSLDETKQHIKVYPNTVVELLKEFFEFYIKFDFNSYVVCPLLGRVVKRASFAEHPEELPPEMIDYITQLEGEDPETFRSNSHMCIQDPFDLSHNLTKAAQPGTLTRFQSMCKLTVAHLESIK